MKSFHNIFLEESPLESNGVQQISGSIAEIPTIEQFPAAMKRLFKNKLLMSNFLGNIFFVLSSSVYFTFMSKYLEVQFHKSAADSTIITGLNNPQVHEIKNIFLTII